MTLEIMILSALGSVLLIVVSLGLILRIPAKKHLELQRELLEALKPTESTPRVTREEALQKARQLKRSRDRVRRLRMVGINPGKYFTPVAANETEIQRRLRQLGINPTDVDIPPEIEQLNQAVNDDGILLPPNPANGRNEGFFQRQEGE